MTILKWSFFALVVSLPLVRLFNLPLFNAVIPATDFIFLAVFAIWTLALLQGKTSLRHSRFYLFLFLYAAAMTLSTVFSTDFNRSAIKLAGEFYLLALAVLTFNVVRNLPDLRRVFFCVVNRYGFDNRGFARRLRALLHRLQNKSRKFRSVSIRHAARRKFSASASAFR